jgi:hypothetical protein
MRQLKLFTGRSLDKPSRDLLALERKQCRPTTHNRVNIEVAVQQFPSAENTDRRRHPPTTYSVSTQHCLGIFRNL